MMTDSEHLQSPTLSEVNSSTVSSPRAHVPVGSVIHGSMPQGRVFWLLHREVNVKTTAFVVGKYQTTWHLLIDIDVFTWDANELSPVASSFSWNYVRIKFCVSFDWADLIFNNSKQSQGKWMTFSKGHEMDLNPQPKQGRLQDYRGTMNNPRTEKQCS